MGTNLLEIQSGASGCQGNILPTMERGDALFLEAQAAWGGTLPGRVHAIQERPLRVEMDGYPPLRLLEALNIELGSEDLCWYWQLRPRTCEASVYHRRTEMVPFPALPAWVTFPCRPQPTVRQTLNWETGEITACRVYVFEWERGALAGLYGALVPDRPAVLDGEFLETAYGLDIRGDGGVQNIERYDQPVRTIPREISDPAIFRLRHIAKNELR